jgi:asparagine synthase (glutamine-hydrolysing)
MCGIFGALTHEPRADLGALGYRLGSVLRHRGPDDHGWLLAGARGIRLGQYPPPPVAAQVFLMHRRLSILDLSEAGRQPLSDPTGRWYIIYNGEVYNYLELRADLEKRGHAFRTATDTEVVLHAFIAWDRAALNRLVGMFALAILDTQLRRVFLARDPFGIKPLYYARPPQALAFASEVKALLPWPGLARTVEPQRLYDYLRFGLTDHGGATLLAHVHQLPPGHCLDLALDRGWAGEPEPYTEPGPAEPIDLPLDEAAGRVRDLFLDNVRLHLRSDVPVGAALSGGVDSSAIVSAMRVVAPGLELHAFSYVADRADLSEEHWVDLAARHTGALPHKVRPTPDELVDDLDELIRVQDEPFGGTSIYAQYRVFRAAREHGVPVMLDGQGADEMLAGYHTFLATRLASLLRRGRWLRAWTFWRSASRLPGVGRPALEALGNLLPPTLRAWGLAVLGRDLMPAWMNRAWFARRGAGPAFAARQPARSLRQHLDQAVARTSLPMLLRYEDRNSMAHSVESRVPFLTTALASFLARLPDEYLLGEGGTSKNVFRRAMRGLVPDPILDRRDKIGFVTPERQWLSHLRPWVEKTLRSECARSIPALEPAALDVEWQAVLAGRRPFDARVWRWANLIRWAERFGVTFA